MTNICKEENFSLLKLYSYNVFYFKLMLREQLSSSKNKVPMKSYRTTIIKSAVVIIWNLVFTKKLSGTIKFNRKVQLNI